MVFIARCHYTGFANGCLACTSDLCGAAIVIIACSWLCRPCVSYRFQYNLIPLLLLLQWISHDQNKSGYSGAHPYGDMKSSFIEACEWASAAENIDVVILSGHWHSEGSGCEESSVTSEVFQELKDLPQCAAIANKLKYFEGHKHCNQIMEANVGLVKKDTSCLNYTYVEYYYLFTY